MVGDSGFESRAGFHVTRNATVSWTKGGVEPHSRTSYTYLLMCWSTLYTQWIQECQDYGLTKIPEPGIWWQRDTTVFSSLAPTPIWKLHITLNDPPSRVWGVTRNTQELNHESCSWLWLLDPLSVYQKFVIARSSLRMCDEIRHDFWSPLNHPRCFDGVDEGSHRTISIKALKSHWPYLVLSQPV